MKYTIKETIAIHIDLEPLFEITNPAKAKVQHLITAEIYAIYKGHLPIIVEGQNKIIEGEKHIGGCILHTKVILSFEKNENPIQDLIKMINEVGDQEEKKWQELIINTPIQGIEHSESDPQVMFNKAYELREAARTRGLLAT